MTPSLLLQYLLPHRALSRIVYWATRWTLAPWKNFLISTVVKNYAVDMSEAVQPDALAYASFNTFFTRALKPGARNAPSDPHAIACPADGKISQAGPIREGRIFQAKGFDFSVAELLGDEIEAQKYTNGQFVTVYLSPRDYHRVHMPLAGTLRETVHVPGRLFSVAPFTVEAVPRLFARNERLVCHFDGEHGPFAIVMVGAMLVSSVETVWSGLEIPPYASAITHKDWRDKQIRLERFAEMGRFNMGSTVILLLPPAVQMQTFPQPGAAVRVGAALGG
ncbi:MAG: phosphatidylserine decarboxylase [Rudaea sp.]|uniref:archaetidylserine decarboxylase n=1 Tax=unclassified Rudaea TaxID=2627037 RepID=UPI0010F5ED66|nr:MULTISPECIES: archaetidylserine decarboxylase [unclassified Rudaea]MBN8887771.1 phosphatidylserine decarboxylase [Rudaea sp.]MBR0346093.1 phosphatidylserine decarboxylase [Rudaea sp.]